MCVCVCVCGFKEPERQERHIAKREHEKELEVNDTKKSREVENRRKKRGKKRDVGPSWCVSGANTPAPRHLRGKGHSL